MSDATDPLAVVDAAATLRILNYTGVSPAALLVYDYLLTFGSEVTYIWPTKMSVMKALFFYTRYSGFVDLFLGVSFHLKDGITPRECKPLFLLIGWLNVIGIIVAEVIMVVRTWAIWEKGRRMGIGLCIMSITAVVAGCLIEGLFLKTLTFTSYPHMNIPGCALTVVLILTLIKGIQRFRHIGMGRTSGLVYVLYRDGILFYLYLFGISTLNFIMILHLPQFGTGLITGYQRVFHCSISARVLINLHEAARHGENTSLLSSVPLRTPVFAENPAAELTQVAIVGHDTILEEEVVDVTISTRPDPRAWLGIEGHTPIIDV